MYCKQQHHQLECYLHLFLLSMVTVYTKPTLPATQTVSHPRYISRFHPGTSHNVNYEFYFLSISTQFTFNVRGAYGILNNDGFGNNNQVEHIAEQKAKVVLQEMHGKDFSEYGFRDACIKVGTQLQSADKDRSYERGVRIR